MIILTKENILSYIKECYSIERSYVVIQLDAVYIISQQI